MVLLWPMENDDGGLYKSGSSGERIKVEGSWIYFGSRIVSRI